jgi:uncharacterized protein DUF2510
MAWMTRTHGLYVLIAGAVIGLVDMFLPNYTRDGTTFTYWTSLDRYDVVFALALFATIVVAVLALQEVRRAYRATLLLLAGAISLNFIPDFLEPVANGTTEYGVWFGAVSAVLCPLGAAVMASREMTLGAEEAMAAATPRRDERAAEDEPADDPSGAPPPPGWYPDPYSDYAHRYWDGSQWTDQVDRPTETAREKP